MSQTLYRKYRPQSFDEIVGQTHIVTTLSNALATDRLTHAYLFTGPRGTGKTTIARIFAASINCTERKDFTPAPDQIRKDFLAGKALDLIEIDAASHTGVDNIREIRDTISLAPSEAPYKVYIIDEVHMLSTGAFNALLKTLEEPPAHAIFILATTDIHKVPETILSRCQRFDFARLTLSEITQKITKIAQQENVAIEPEAAEMIAVTANGGMRDAESLLAQIFALEDKTVTPKEVALILGTTTGTDVQSLVTSLVAQDVWIAMGVVQKIVDGGFNINIFIQSTIHSLRGLLYYTLIHEKPPTSKDTTAADYLPLTASERSFLTEQASQTSSRVVLDMITHCEKALRDTPRSPIPQLPLEIAIVEICGPGSDTPPITPQKKTTSKDAKKSALKKSPTVEKSTKPSQNTLEKTAAETTLAEPVADPAASPHISLETVQEKWSDVITSLQKDNPSIASILGKYIPTSLEGTKVSLPVKYDLHKEKLMNAEVTLTLSTVLATIFGTSLKIVPVKEVVQETSKKEVGDTGDDILSHAQSMLGGTVVEG